MNIAAFFIKRPVATVLMSLAITLAGLVAYVMLPVSPLPQVDFPTVFVSASLPGASPKTMAASVATPLERALGRIAGVTEMTSSSSLGSARIIVQFDLSRNIDGAARDVQAAINAAISDLPAGMPSNPTYRKVNPADAPVMIIALTSDTLPIHELYDSASTVLAQKISQMPGIGQVVAGGGSLPAVRVEMNPDMLNSYAISMEDVRTVIRNANVNAPKGVVESDQHHWLIGGNSQLLKANEYGAQIIAWRNNAPVRLRDVASVTDSVQDIRNSGLANGKPAVLLIIFRQPGANIIEAVDRIQDALPFLKASIPEAIDLRVMVDRTSTIRASLADVQVTLYISVLLVIVVVFAFLRSARATFIPSIAVPVSLIGTFAGMYLCGYSLDNLSLMALAIATGFVVDDAIVVLENISRHMEDGLPALEAAFIGAKEVSFTVISISLSLIAVFIPILFMGGMVGRLFREFAVTLSIAIMVSLLLSLTLTPMLCAYLLHAKDIDVTPHKKRNRMLRQARYMAKKSGAAAGYAGMRIVLSKLGAIYTGMQNFYHASLGWVLDHPRLTMCFWLATVCLNIYLYIFIPKGFFPIQDTGRITGSVRADQSISFQAMKEKQAVLMEAVMNDPAVQNVAGFYGGGQSTSVFAALKPAGQRDATAEEVIARLRQKLAGEPGARLFMQSDQDLRMGGRSSRASTQYTLQGDDLDELRQWAELMTNAMDKISVITDVNSDQEDRGLQSSLVIDRDSASRMGVTVRQIDSALNNAFGQRQVATMYKDRNQYRVVMEANRALWQGPEGFRHIWVPTRGASASGVPTRTITPLVPLGAFARYEPTQAPVRVNHQGQSAAATISFNLALGASLSDATAAIEQVKRDIGMPPSIQGGFQGTAKLFGASLASQPWLVLAAIISLYIVLGILYESYIHPITILSTLPSAGVGALLALRLVNMNFSVIAFIGILLLAGIVKKNAILLIDFAIEAERLEKLSPLESIRKACLLRFRPIMMTTMAALLGAVPLAIGFGEGAELRRPLGVSIVGGLIMSQLLTLYTTPVIYLYLDRFQAWWRAKRGTQVLPIQPALQGGV